MRKRSGAIHSETQEQFIMLAQQAYGKNGLFYDDKHYHRISKCFKKKQRSLDNPQPSNQSKSENPFKNFDFNEKIEEQLDLQKLEEEMKAHNISSINVAVICDSNEEIFRQLQPDSNEEPSNRGFDLLIRKESNENKKQYVFKYWIISRELCLNCIYDVYLQQAIKIFAVGMPHSTQELVTLKDKYDISYIELKSMKNIFEKFQSSNL